MYEGWVFEPFSILAPQTKFDCGDPDLNEFFLRDLIPHEEQLITKTFILFPLSDNAPVELACPVHLLASAMMPFSREHSRRMMPDRQ